MVRIRFRRVGGRGQPSYRLVAADKESPRDGRFIEILGYYNPRTEPATIQLKEDRIFDWMSKGAQPSDSALSVMNTAGTMDRYERFKAGEDIEDLLAEAKSAEAARNINAKTTRIISEGTPVKEKKAKPVETAEAETQPAEAEVAEVVEADLEDTEVEEAEVVEVETEETEVEEDETEDTEAEEAEAVEDEAEDAEVEEAEVVEDETEDAEVEEAEAVEVEAEDAEVEEAEAEQVEE